MSNAGRKPDRYTGIIYMDEFEVDIFDIKQGGTAEAALLSQ